MSRSARLKRRGLGSGGKEEGADDMEGSCEFVHRAGDVGESDRV